MIFLLGTTWFTPQMLPTYSELPAYISSLLETDPFLHLNLNVLFWNIKSVRGIPYGRVSRLNREPSFILFSSLLWSRIRRKIPISYVAFDFFFLFLYNCMPNKSDSFICQVIIWNGSNEGMNISNILTFQKRRPLI